MNTRSTFAWSRSDPTPRVARVHTGGDPVSNTIEGAPGPASPRVLQVPSKPLTVLTRCMW